MNVQFLTSNYISSVQWNKTISESVFPLTYAYTWYLNTVCDNWGAVLTDDYSVVIPLPLKTKFNQQHVYLPPFVPKLDLFYKKLPSTSIIENLFAEISNNVSSVNYSLNKFSGYNKEKISTKKVYYSIDLFNSYDKIYNEYSSFLKSNLNTNSANKYVVTGILSNEIISFLNKMNFFADAKYNEYLRKIISILSVKRLSSIIAVFSEKNELLGIGVYILSSYTADLTIAAAKNDDISILSLLIDKFIKINSNKVLTLNFECHFSNNISKLYAEFGAIKYYKTNIVYKKVPKIFRFFKKNKKY